MPTRLAGLLRDGRLSALVVYIGFLAILVFFAITLWDRNFLTVGNMMTIVRQTTPITIMAVGMTFALCAGQIDLSVGATVALAALVTAIVIREAGMAAGIVAGLATGTGVGLVNGVLTVALRIPSLLVTLGTMGIVTGVARMTTNLEAVPIQVATFNDVFGGGVIYWSLAALIIGHLALNNVVYGRRVLATGGDVQAARAAGIDTVRVTVGIFVLTGVTAAIAGMIYSGRLHGARYSLGDQDVLTVIAAVVIGGTSLFGGKGSVIGAVVGSLLLGMLNNGLILSGYTPSEQMVARGVILIMAVALSLREVRQ
jgi:ribose transport system permease protein